MKHIFTLLLCLSIGHQANIAASCNTFLASSKGAAAAAVLGGYVVPAGMLSFFSSPLQGAIKAIPSFAGAALACLLQQQKVSAKWGCDTKTGRGTALTFGTYFVFAALVDELAQLALPQYFASAGGPVDAACRAGLTTAGLYATFGVRNAMIGK